MKKFDIVTKVNRTFHKAGFQLKKHSPEILVVTGVIGVVTSAVLACKATRKLDSVLEESKEQIDKIKDYIEEEGYSEEYTEKDASKDLTITYTQSALKTSLVFSRMLCTPSNHHFHRNQTFYKHHTAVSD